MLKLEPPDIQRPELIEINLPVFAFAAAVSILTTLVFGLAPAIAASRSDLNSALKAGGAWGASAARVRSRQFLIAVEVAMALVLVAGAEVGGVVGALLAVPLTALVGLAAVYAYRVWQQGQQPAVPTPVPPAIEVMMDRSVGASPPSSDDRRPLAPRSPDPVNPNAISSGAGATKPVTNGS